MAGVAKEEQRAAVLAPNGGRLLGKPRSCSHPHGSGQAHQGWERQRSPSPPRCGSCKVVRS
eukprot:6751495-Prorocentrum_lima.AAC.1